MPGESRGDVPAAVPLQIAVETSGLCTNGDASSPGGAEGKTLKCGDCNKAATIVCGGCWTFGYCGRDHQMSGWEKHRPKCRPWRVGMNTDMGRYMVATRDIAAGEELVQDPPLLLGPKMVTEPICLGCYRTVEGEYSCRGCGFPLCSTDCEGTEDHEPECKAVRDSGVPVKVSVFGETNSMYECITPLRVLNLRDESPILWNKIMSLENNCDMRDGTQVATITQQTVVDIIHGRLQLDDEYDQEIIEKVLGVLDTNGFEIRLTDSSILGVYQTAAMLEHDCIPNTHRTFDADLNLVVRAAVPIKRGDHLTACYTEPLATTASRQEHLRATKYFICGCRRCTDPTELGAFMSALRCSECKDTKSEDKGKKSEEKGESSGVKGRSVVRGGMRKGGVANRINAFQTGGAGKSGASTSAGASASGEDDKPGAWLVPQDPLSPTSHWKCLSCGYKTSDDYADRITAVAQEEAEELEATNPTVAQCEAFLEKWESTFHPDHAIFLNLKYALLHLYGSEEGYELEEMNPIQLIRKEELCNQVLRVANIIQPGISRLRGSVHYELYQSLFYRARSMFLVGAVSSEQARKIALDALTNLKECARVLGYEPEVQPEGQLGLEAKEEIKQLQKWIKEEGWKY